MGDIKTLIGRHIRASGWQRKEKEQYMEGRRRTLIGRVPQIDCVVKRSLLLLHIALGSVFLFLKNN